MVHVTFVANSGEESTSISPGEESLMQVAVNNDIEGIEAECGGEMNCGTCHVYVDQAWCSQLVAPSDAELEMIEVLDKPRPESRLSCQIRLSSELDGLRVIVAGA